MKIYFPNLDALRTFACLAVILQHSVGWTIKFLPVPDAVKTFLSLFQNGELGVQFFFVLSGFLISYLLLSEIDLEGKVNVKNFYIRRILRIWPLYYTVLIIAFYIYPYIYAWISKEIIHQYANHEMMYFFFLGNIDRIAMSAANLGAQTTSIANITWSVAIEEQFYVIWPLIFYFTPKQYLKYAILSLVIGAQIFKILNYGNENSILYFHTFSNIQFLALGGLFALTYSSFARFQEAIQNVSRNTIIAIYVLCIPLLAAYKYMYAFEKISYELLIACFFAFVILEQNFAKNSFFKFGKLRLVTSIGKYTYGMYLLHPIVIHFVEDFFKFGLGISQGGLILAFIKGGLIVCITVGIAYLSYEFFEVKFLALKKKFSYITKD